MEWLKDKNGNQCAVEYFGSREATQKALDSLKDCKNCINCSRCSGCSGCSRCSGCSGCSDCSDCSRCSGCSGCSDCSDCSRCSDCSDCSRCSDCSDCSRCSRCSGCSDCSDLEGKKEGKGTFKVPTVPIIPDIHKRVYEAASKPESLNMKDWHTCEKTHCRGGWVVTLAGPEGKALEEFHGTALAAMLIYDASDPKYKINPGRFFDSNEEALEDMKKLAKV